MFYGIIQNGLRMATLRLMPKFATWLNIVSFHFSSLLLNQLRYEHIIIFHNNTVHTRAVGSSENPGVPVVIRWA